jgi:D-aminopeptidase
VKPRARDLGIEIGRLPTGPLNAVTDVTGVRVGHTTLVEGTSVRTGVTVVLPPAEPLFAGAHRINGNGELTGLEWVRDSGLLTTPIGLTNTHSVGVVRDALVAQSLPGEWDWSLPVVGETWDGVLNDINGFHVRPEHVFAALDNARAGVVGEGAVGGGTGMLCNGFKGGIGTSSRVLPSEEGGFTVGVLVQCNYGSRPGLRIAGAPVGKEFTAPMVCVAGSSPPSREWLREMPRCGQQSSSRERPQAELGSIIIVIATDAPVLPHQLRRLVKRASLGLGREGSIASNFSGDIFVAFSTANPGAAADSGLVALQMLPNERLDPLFGATVQATEEAVTNALVAAETMTGADDIRAYGLPHARLVEILRKYGRIPPPASR